MLRDVGVMTGQLFPAGNIKSGSLQKPCGTLAILQRDPQIPVLIFKVKLSLCPETTSRNYKTLHMNYSVNLYKEPMLHFMPQ